MFSSTLSKDFQKPSNPVTDLLNVNLARVALTFPYEVISMIFERLDFPDFHSLLFVCKQFNLIAIPFLFKQVIISEKFGFHAQQLINRLDHEPNLILHIRHISIIFDKDMHSTNLSFATLDVEQNPTLEDICNIVRSAINLKNLGIRCKFGGIKADEAVGRVLTVIQALNPMNIQLSGYDLFRDAEYNQTLREVGKKHDLHLSITGIIRWCRHMERDNQRRFFLEYFNSFERLRGLEIVDSPEEPSNISAHIMNWELLPRSIETLELHTFDVATLPRNLRTLRLRHIRGSPIVTWEVWHVIWSLMWLKDLYLIDVSFPRLDSPEFLSENLRHLTLSSLVPCEPSRILSSVSCVCRQLTSLCLKTKGEVGSETLVLARSFERLSDFRLYADMATYTFNDLIEACNSSLPRLVYMELPYPRLGNRAEELSFSHCWKLSTSLLKLNQIRFHLSSRDFHNMKEVYKKESLDSQPCLERFTILIKKSRELHLLLSQVRRSYLHL
jgi:hypothetical protein